ncbi:MAG: endonuclease [Cyanobacteria bacterium P01_A01_bin.40]
MHQKRLSMRIISRVIASIVFTLSILVISNPVLADQTEIPNYNQARKVFWRDLYPDGGKSIYCNINASLDNNEDEDDSDNVNIEHVYPASWMKEAADCLGSNRKECRQNSPRFNLMEADLHNLYPSLANLNQARGSFNFAIIDGTATDSCDFEVQGGLVEPRPDSRGNIARVFFYMNDEYGAAIAPPNPTGSADLKDLLTDWHCKDPVDSAERDRNDIIESLQGTRNKFIDDPSLVSCSNIATFPDD